MAATLPDLILVSSAYTNIYAATGIAVGTPLLLQNKSSSTMTVQIKATQPSPTSADGNYLVTNEFLVVDGTIPGCWVKGSGRLSVQVMEQ